MKTITGGSFQDSKGTPANGATITFVLLTPEVATNTGQVYPNTVSFTLDASGNLPAASQIWANDELTPTGSVYRVTVVSPSGIVLYGPQTWSIVGTSPISITDITPVQTPAGLFVSNVAIEPGTSDGVIYVSPNGSSANSGLSWGTAIWGSDIGAAINTAIAKLPVDSAGAPFGNIYLGGGVFPFSTTIVLPATQGRSAINIHGIYGGGGGAGTGFPGLSTAPVVLEYTGSGVAIQQIAASNVFGNILAGGLHNLVLDGTNAGTGAIGVKIGGTQGFLFENVFVTNFAGTSQIGVQLDNSVNAGFTERTRFVGCTFNNNTIGLQFKMEGGITASSFGHMPGNTIQFGIFAGQTGISCVGGAQVYDSDFNLNGNASGASTVISVDATSGFKASLNFGLENDGTATRFSVASGGVVDVWGYFPNAGGFTDSNSGTLTIIGDVNDVLQAPVLSLLSATPTGTGTALGLGNTSGFGNGAAGTTVTTTLKGTGSGPTTPQTVVKYLEVDIGGTKFWLPLVQ